MKVGIIVVTFNSQKDIARLLESIIIQQYKDFIIYLVDNDSKDQTLNIIQKYLTKISICIISTMNNNGFAKGNNIGIQRAMDDGCDFVFILNPDMQLEEKCIDVLTERIKSDEKIAAIGPVVLDGNKTGNFIQSYGFKANFRTQMKDILFSGKELTNEIPSEIYVDYVLGGVMMIRSNVLKTTGFFEEDYFMYNDELDIAYRIKNSGYKTLCVRDAIVRHYHGTIKKNRSGYNLMYYYMMRNKYLYFKKFRLYTNILFSLIKEVVSLPLKIRWAILRMHNIKLLIFYYSGLLDGLLGKKGIANRSFD
jgi:GT2 family glycosyltransferase